VKVRFFGLSIFLTVSFFSQSHAQLFIGPVAGANFSWTSFDDKDLKDVYNVVPVWGYHAGVQGAFRVRKRFYLNTSLVYSTKGKVLNSADEQSPQHDPFLRNKVTYKFIEMPILYNVDFLGKMGGKSFKYFLGVGPNLSYWLGGKGELWNVDLEEINYPSENKKLEYKIVFKQDENTLPEDQMNVAEPNRFQLGLNFAAGLDFEPSRNSKMIVMLRYELGGSFLSKTSNGYFITTPSYQDPLRVRNQGFRISVAYLYDLKLEQRKKGKSTIKRKSL